MLPPTLQVADLPALRARLAQLEAAAAATDLWEQQARAQGVLRQLAAAREEVGALDRFSGQLEDLGVALELLEMEVGLGVELCWEGGLCCWAEARLCSQVV